MARKIPIVVQIGARDRFSSTMARVSRRLAKFGSKLKAVGRTLSTSLSLPSALAGAAVIKVGADFERSMNRARAVMGLIGPESEQTFQKMRERAKTMGISTEKSATEAADALVFLGMAGFSAEQSMQALEGVINLSTVAQVDLAQATDIATNILTGYGKQASDIAQVNNVLVATFTKSNTSLEELGNAFKMVGPLAANMKIPIEEMAAMLGKLGDQGIKGTMAGRVLRRAIVNLLRPSRMARKALARLKIDPASIVDSSGKINSLTSILERLRAAGATGADIIKIFGVTAGPGMTGLIDGSLPALRQLQAEIEGAGNITDKVSTLFRSGAAGAFDSLRSAVEGLGIAIGESGLLADVTRLAQGLTVWIRKLAETEPQTLRLAAGVGIVAIVLGPLIVAVGLLVQSFAVLAGVANILLIKFAGFVILKTIAIGFQIAAGAVGLLKAAFLAFGALGPLAIITALAAAALLLYHNWDEVSAKLSDIFGGIKNFIVDSVKVIFSYLDKLFGIGDKIQSLASIVGGLSGYIFGESKTPKFRAFESGGIGGGLAGGPGMGAGVIPSAIGAGGNTKNQVEVRVDFSNLPRGAKTESKATPGVALQSHRSGVNMGSTD